MSTGKPIPNGYTAVTPYLLVEGAAEFMEFLADAFNAVERRRVPMPQGGIGHAEVEIDGAVLMVADAFPPDFPATKSLLHLYVGDVDSTYAQAVKAGAAAIAGPSDESYGDRMARVLDPCGNQWIIATAG
ncbi:MAG: VOC family protein [Chloroflexota bacterium]|nr:VOC family protein [Chloroflexota bacterium]MDE2840126.1 VOC family protein [Chloroflexota bacterium]MDE2930348.1 VOC family protein [Chloroflexota bacterium]